MPRTIWISGLVPTQGADTYNGIRLAYSDTKREAYEDLYEWLEGVEELREGLDDGEYIAAVEATLDDSDEVRYWNVEHRVLLEVDNA